ncbi:MAG TPA: DNA recombination protein RmuC [Tepidiformaceae bacterium]|nr:DNA recombination protein RmuC [Tepidiformaceae bacterium]
MVAAVLIVGLALAGAVGALAWSLSRRTPLGAASDGGSIGVLSARLEGVPQAVMATREQLTALNERVGALESSSGAVRDGLARLDTSLAQTGTVASGIREATESIRQEIARAQEGLGQLHASARSRQQLEEMTAQSIRRLEAVIAGTAAKGAAGENICELVFSRLPAEWQERDFRIGNRTVEFALRLPNNLVVPVDSKWPGTHLLEQFLESNDIAEQQRLKTQIQQAVLGKAREVRKYVDPGLTTDYSVAVVPDAVYELCGEILGEVVRLEVMLVSHSMFVPCLLMLFQAAVRDSREIDVEKLSGYLKAADQGLRALQEEIEGRLSRAITMLGNSRDELRAQTARVSTGLAAISVPSTAPRLLPPSPVDDLLDREGELDVVLGA